MMHNNYLLSRAKGSVLLLLFWFISHAVWAQTCFNPTSVTFTGFSSTFNANNGTYTPATALFNGAPRWFKDGVTTARYIAWSGSRWELRVPVTSDLGYNLIVFVNGTINSLPCTGWQPDGTTNYGTPTLTGGCGSLTTTAPSLTVTATPSLTVAPGSSVTLTASGATTYRWQNASTDNFIFFVNRQNTTNFSVVGTTGTCSSTFTGQIIVATPAPPLTLTTGLSPNPVLTNTPISLSVGATGGRTPYTYAWTAPVGTSISGASTASAITATASVSGLQTFTVTVSSASGGPVSTTTLSVQVNAPLRSIRNLPTQVVLGSGRGCPTTIGFDATGSRFEVLGPNYRNNHISQESLFDKRIFFSSIGRVGTYSVCAYDARGRSLGCTSFEVTGTSCR